MTSFRKPLLVLSIGAALIVTPLLSTSIVEAKGKPEGGGAAYQVVTLAPPNSSTWRSGLGDLSEAGNAVGFYEETGGETRAFLYDATTQVFTSLNGGTDATGLNSANRIVGAVDKIAGKRTGLYWHGATENPLLLEPLPGDTESLARDINDAGIITGVSIRRDAANRRDVFRAVAWKVEVGESVTISDPVDLGVLPGDTDSEASRLNELSNDGTATVVGESSQTVIAGYDKNDQPIYELVSLAAVTWTVGIDQFGDLVKLAGPVDLGNNSGHIAGVGQNPTFGSGKGAFLLIPNE